MNSFESPLIRQISKDRYTPMEPIFYSKSKSNRSTPEHVLEYKPVYASNLLNRRLGNTMDKEFPKLSEKPKSRYSSWIIIYFRFSVMWVKFILLVVDQMTESTLSSTQYHCVDEYVEMSLPSGSTCNSPRTPVAKVSPQQQISSKQQPPIPSPRIDLEYGDYANISAIIENSQNGKRVPTNEDDDIIDGNIM